MKAVALWALLLYLGSVTVSGGAAPEVVKRFGLIIGANDGGGERVRLRYAVSDAQQMATVLHELGGVEVENSTVLTEPAPADILRALELLDRKMARESATGKRTELIVYYSGHSDEKGLLLSGERFAYTRFRDLLKDSPAKVRIAVVDACASGALTRLKGGKRRPPFTVDKSMDTRGYAFLTSSTAEEAAQESDLIQGSYFTHALLSGLRGAADLNGDSKVTLHEAYQFAFQETLARTEQTEAGAQHPGYDMRLSGTGDVVLTDLRQADAILGLGEALKGRVWIRGSRGLAAELEKAEGIPLTLALEPDDYDIHVRRGEAAWNAKVSLIARKRVDVHPGDLIPVALKATRTRGTDLSPPTTSSRREPFHLGLVPGVGLPWPSEGNEQHALSLSLLWGQAQKVQGLQMGTLVSSVSQELDGLQVAGAWNHSGGPVRGLQLALGGNRAEGPVNVAQIALGFNLATESLRGVQAAGLANATGRMRGVQVAPVNVVQHGKGLQAGLVNVADTLFGAQVGLVNVSKHLEGPFFGLVAIAGNGLLHMDLWRDTRELYHATLVMGGPYNYIMTDLAATREGASGLRTLQAGLGVHVPLKPLYLEAELSSGAAFSPHALDNTSWLSRGRLLMGGMLRRRFGIYAGTSLSFEVWGRRYGSNLQPEDPGFRFDSASKYQFQPDFFLGVRL